MRNFALLPIPDWEVLERAQSAFEANPSIETEVALASALETFCRRALRLAQFAAVVGDPRSVN